MTLPSKATLVGETALSRVDGVHGVLLYRGYDILDLGTQATYEEVVHLLWYGELPDSAALARLRAELSAHRRLPPFVRQTLQRCPRQAHPMAVLRTAVSAFGLTDPSAADNSLPSLQHKALALTAVTPSLVAAWERLRRGATIIPPRADLGHAANFLYMLTGRDPQPAAARALEAFLVCLADHAFNPSTFACRFTFATLSDIYAAVTAGLGALQGVAHGGANQAAMEQFTEADGSGDIPAWYARRRAAGGRIMGVAHPIYQVQDPRRQILAPLAEQMAAGSDAGHWFQVAARIEALTQQDPYFVERRLHANVDFYSAVVLTMLGLPLDQFTCLFALARMAGWTAHVMEQAVARRMLQPEAAYVGLPRRPFTPLVQR